MNITSQKLPFTNISINPSLLTIHIECEGLMPSDSFRHTMLYLIELVNSKNLVACVYDIRNLKGLPPQDQDWFIDEALPLLIQTPLRKVAILDSITGSGLLDFNQLVYCQYPSIPFELQYFEDVASSFEWISTTLAVKEKLIPFGRKSLAPFV